MSNYIESLNICIWMITWSAPLTLKHEDTEAREVKEFVQNDAPS